MIPNEIRKKLQNIINGTCFKGATDHCATVRNLLIESFGTGSTIKAEFESKAIVKEKQAGFLKSWAKGTDLWFDALPSGSAYLTRGGESKIYLAPDKMNVIKLNEAIYYATWDEYLNSIALHNLLFSNTSYSLVGFMEIDNDLCGRVATAFYRGRTSTAKRYKRTFNL